MADFSDDRFRSVEIERTVRAELDLTMREAAKLSEFTVDAPSHLEARPPLTDEQYEAAVALNALAVLLDERAGEACKAGEPRWEGLADAATMARNAAGYSGLPQLFPD